MERIYPCPWCESKVSKPENLRRHVQLRHKKLRCSNCGKSLTKCKDFNAVGQSFACETNNLIIITQAPRKSFHVDEANYELVQDNNGEWMMFVDTNWIEIIRKDGTVITEDGKGNVLSVVKP